MRTHKNFGVQSFSFGTDPKAEAFGLQKILESEALALEPIQKLKLLDSSKKTLKSFLILT